MSSLGRTDICSSHRNGNITSVTRMLAAVYSSARRRRSWRLRSRCARPTVIARLSATLLMGNSVAAEDADQPAQQKHTDHHHGRDRAGIAPVGEIEGLDER